MTISTAPAPPRQISPARTSAPKRRGSPLNPQTLKPPALSTTNTNTNTTASSTLKHLSNLDRLLQKQSLIPSTTTTSIHFSPDPVPDPPSPRPHLHGLLHALNLPSLFGPHDEMSPRSLSHLHRLLADSPRPSPKNPIFSRWRDFHGRQNWAGLLDPLHPDLRRELLRAGDLVSAAYRSFHSNPSSPRPFLLPDRSYRHVAPLHATSSLQFPAWARPLAPAKWMAHRSSWAGFVAVCDNEREIQRMGRRDIVIALRGTATCLEWAENFRAGLVPISSSSSSLDEASSSSTHVPKVECGFLSLFQTPGEHVPSLAEAVVQEVTRLMEKYAGEELSITVTGHSLGAALALLVAHELSARIPRVPPIAVFSFGGPRVGNRAFAEQVEAQGVKVLRVVNAHDVITRVPGVLPARSGPGDGYADVGVELRLDSRSSPYLKPNADPACCHDLEAYLHLVDGFMGSGCPFRSNAKRSIARLMELQQGNMRRVYVAKARELTLGQLDSTAGPNVPACLASPSS